MEPCLPRSKSEKGRQVAAKTKKTNKQHKYIILILEVAELEKQLDAFVAANPQLEPKKPAPKYTVNYNNDNTHTKYTISRRPLYLIMIIIILLILTAITTFVTGSRRLRRRRPPESRSGDPHPFCALRIDLSKLVNN